MLLNTVLKLIFAPGFIVIMLPSQGALQGLLEQDAGKNASAWLIKQKGANPRMEHAIVSLVTKANTAQTVSFRLVTYYKEELKLRVFSRFIYWGRIPMCRKHHFSCLLCF